MESANKTNPAQFSAIAILADVLRNNHPNVALDVNNQLLDAVTQYNVQRARLDTLQQASQRWREIARANLPEEVFNLYEHSIEEKYKLPNFVEACARPLLDGLCCSCCHTPFKINALGSWRWNGNQWEHKCADVDPQCGHFAGTTFQERLTEALSELQQLAEAEVLLSTHVALSGIIKSLQPYLRQK